MTATAALVRYPILLCWKIAGQLDLLEERANFTAIGTTGHVSVPDEYMTRARKLKPLNRFERWLLGPIIEEEQARRRQAFREAVMEATGEDPETDWH